MPSCYREAPTKFGARFAPQSKFGAWFASTGNVAPNFKKGGNGTPNFDLGWSDFGKICSMPISDPGVPVRFLAALARNGIPFVVLHGEGKVGSPSLVSDLDLAVGMPARVALERVRAELAGEGLVPAMLWPYDVGGTVGVFVGSRADARGAQIDLLFDPRGRGRYGIRSGEILAQTKTGASYPVPDPLDQDLYLLRKAAVKGRTAEVRALRERLSARREASARVREIFSPAAGRQVDALLHGGAAPFRSKLRPVRVAASSARMVRRLARPVGWAAELVSSDADLGAQAADLADRFGGWLVSVRTAPRPTSESAARAWWYREVWPARLRPCLFISWTRTQVGPAPDITLKVDERTAIDDLARDLLEAMGRGLDR